MTDVQEPEGTGEEETVSSEEQQVQERVDPETIEREEQAGKEAGEERVKQQQAEREERERQVPPVAPTDQTAEPNPEDNP